MQPTRFELPGISRTVKVIIIGMSNLGNRSFLLLEVRCKNYAHTNGFKQNCCENASKRYDTGYLVDPGIRTFKRRLNLL